MAGIYTAVGKTGGSTETEKFYVKIENNQIDCTVAELQQAITEHKTIMVNYQSKDYIVTPRLSGTTTLLYAFGSVTPALPLCYATFYAFTVYSTGNVFATYYTTTSYELNQGYTPTGVRSMTQAEFENWAGFLQPWAMYYMTDTHTMYIATGANSYITLVPQVATVQDVIINASQTPITCNLTAQELAENTILALKNHTFPLDIQVDVNYNYMSGGSFMLSSINIDTETTTLTIYLESFDQIRLIYDYTEQVLTVDLNYAGETTVYYEQITITPTIQEYLDYLMGLFS